MTSYQKRKEEIKELKKELKNAQSLALEVKHYLLAVARGQENHVEQCKKAVLKRLPEFANICDIEKKELEI